MAVRLEGEDRTDLEHRIERLEATLQAVVQETTALTVQGPCPHCGECLLLRDRRSVYCPKCREGRNV